MLSVKRQLCDSAGLVKSIFPNYYYAHMYARGLCTERASFLKFILFECNEK